MSDNPQESREKEEPKVKVSDRRRFTSGGEARDPAEVDPAEEQKAAASSPPDLNPESTPPQPDPAGSPGDSQQRTGMSGLPPASFELLVLSLAMQAQMELGVGEPQPGQVPNLDIARHTIDLLGILQQKTKGNLTLDEQRLLENTLTELRFRYVQALDQINKKATS